MKRIPLWLIFVILFLVLISFSALYVIDGGFKNIIRESIYVLLGFAIVFCITFFDFRVLKYFVWFIYSISLVLLLSLLFIGISIHASTRWISFFGLFTIQPSEFAKISMIVTLSYVLSQNDSQFKKFVYASLLLFPYAILIYIQPDMGTTLVIVFIYFYLILIALPVKYAMSLVGCGVALIPLGSKILQPYQIERIVTLFDPGRDPLGAGYNVIQSMIAIGSGGVTGRGIAGSTMTKMKFVPVQYADFIFSAVGEIWGFIGGITVIALYVLLLIYFVRTFKVTENIFGKLLASGIFAMFLFQIFINIGMCMGIMPVTGIPLPFLSIGGSSTVANFIAIGLAVNINIFKDEMRIFV